MPAQSGHGRRRHRQSVATVYGFDSWKYIYGLQRGQVGVEIMVRQIDLFKAVKLMITGFRFVLHGAAA